MVRNGSSAQQLSVTHPLYLLLFPANCDSVAAFELEIEWFLFTIEKDSAVICKYAHTLAAFELISFVSQLGGGQSDSEHSVGTWNYFDFEAFSIFELLLCKYGSIIRIVLRFDGDHSFLDYCRVAVGSVNFGDCFGEVVDILYLLRFDESCFW